MIRNFPLTGKLVPGDASAVILYTEEGEYVVQLRDDLPGIFFPGHYGLFGGALENNESYLDCARREVLEETGLDLGHRLVPFMSLPLDFGPFGHGTVGREFFTAEISKIECESINLTEGQAFRVLTASQLFNGPPIAPYDAFALWQHANLTHDQ